MTLYFLPEAVAELCEAAQFYEGREPGLGASDFVARLRTFAD